ncbi:MAG: 3-phosphoglycerate dehydrogenase, partial [Planctomycetaceae bacterium]|nr:3-phosphoglycerate dehydrogenase [Planctomycetaceae bacterium]
MPKVMCTSLNAEQGPHHEIFREAGYEVQVAPRSIDLWQEENLINLLADCHGVLAGSEPYTPSVIESLPNLR